MSEHGVDCVLRKGRSYYAMPEFHAHDSLVELYYLVSGERRHFVGGEVFTMAPGGFLFIREGILHKTSFSGPGAHERWAAHLPSSWLLPLDFLPSFFSASDCGFLAPLFAELSDELSRTDQASIHLVRSLATRIVLLAWRKSRDSGKEGDPFVGKVNELVERNLKGDLSLSSVSSELGFSPTHFSRLFHGKAGMKWSDFLRAKRVSVAAAALERGASVAEASCEAGFSDPGYMKDVFKAVTGIPPSSWRKARKGS